MSGTRVALRLIVLVFQVLWGVLRIVVKLVLSVAFGVDLDDEVKAKKEVDWDALRAEADVWTEWETQTAEVLAPRFELIIADAGRLTESIRRDRASDHLVLVLDDYVVVGAREWLAHVEDGDYLAEAGQAAASFEIVLAQLEVFVGQRRDPTLRHALGDADAMAMACYQPLFEFARANRVPLTTIVPMTMLTPFDLATWTGFIPTGIAPIFLPRDFFDRLAWWPALAHEIGHDLLAATTDAEDKLRHQLGLPPEEVGVVPLRVTPSGVTANEVYRVFGGWFEEIFCDIAATMMVGPAYGWTMIELFSERGGRSVRDVVLDSGGQSYGVHPPRHLRLVLCTQVLELMGEDAAASDLRAAWGEIHGAVDRIVFPTAVGPVGVPMELLAQMTLSVATRLYRDPLEGFDGHSLSDIPGLDYGPHAAAEVQRTAASLLAGQPARTRNARWIIGAAVLAARRAPDREVEILAAARVAIVGKAEWAEDPLELAARIGGASDAIDERRAAFILHTVFTPPPSLRRTRGGLAQQGLGNRRAAG